MKTLVFPAIAIHVTQHALALWPQILLHTKGSLRRVCQNEVCHQVNNALLQVLSIAITLAARVLISHSLRFFISADSPGLPPGFSKCTSNTTRTVFFGEMCPSHLTSGCTVHPEASARRPEVFPLWMFWDLKAIWRGLPHWPAQWAKRNQSWIITYMWND